MSKETAGWVVQLTIPAKAPLEHSSLRSYVAESPSLKFFNVALAEPEQAIDAARKKADAPADASIQVIRALSPAELDFIHLRRGEAKPA